MMINDKITDEKLQYYIPNFRVSAAILLSPIHFQLVVQVEPSMEVANCNIKLISKFISTAV